MRNTPSRDSTSLTGRLVTFAAAAQSAELLHNDHLPPKAPPTNGEITRTFSGLMSNMVANWCLNPVHELGGIENRQMIVALPHSDGRVQL